MVKIPSFPRFQWDFLVIYTPKGEYFILSCLFLNHLNPSIYWRQALITFNADCKDYYDPSKSSSNDFSSSKSCEALVCDSRTPSFPSSVQIASFNSSHSLLSSRDEVFKEIQDVEEENHDPLEELWDKEEELEEVETVMKVVPSAFHHYFKVFPKVKAEKLPPHHACDLHIELEGFLPPVGVIYSLSNQNSDKLGAYISENIYKDFIFPSSFLSGAPVLFFKKKDGGLCFCVDYCKLNSFTRKHKYLVPPINHIITVCNGSCIFSKIYLHGAYNLLRIKEGD
ncbi:hypothetical protein O181_013017 [Austropuccinia psidii MF-1]|uniref:Uncharacterized protein n=1 Tax=Austropuccinia psidii MF-1 TaxID=1389203 RepID=A0A9Q3BXG7_9BASI|nr:hypothetical protein [Austropuccinia psidii MF-1]